MNTNDERTRFFEETYSQYHKKLENICLRYVDYDEEYRDLIDESIQETYLTAVAEYESLRKHTALEGWFVKTCYNRFTTAVSTYRRRKNCHAYSLDDEEKVPQVAQTISALDAWLARENMEAYTRRVLDTLNNREAEIFHERFEEDIKLSDIAKRQHSTASAIKSVLSRIKAKAHKLKNTDFIFFILFFASFACAVRLMK